MEKIMKYKIIKSTDSYWVESEVNEWLAEGYLLHGELQCVKKMDDEVLFVQPLVKCQPPPTKSGGLEGKSANSEPRGKAVD